MNDASASRPVLSERVRALAYQTPASQAEPDLVVDPGIRRLHLNESPLAPSPKVVQAVTAAAAYGAYYPDNGCTALATRLARMTHVAPERMAFGNGSGELLLAATLAVIGPGDEAVLPAPTFPTCGRGVQIAGGRRIDVPLRDDGGPDIGAMIAAITPRTRLVYVCSPQNPTGTPLSEAELSRLSDAVPGDTMLLIDEAYFEFGRYAGGPDGLAVASRRQGAWLITRTLSKAYSLAGFRVGYALCSSGEIAEALGKLRPGFIVGRVALAAGCAALDDVAYHENIVATVSAERERLAAGLRALGFSVLPSATNFLAALPPHASATRCAEALARVHMLTQPMPWRTPNGMLRISIGTAADTDALLAVLRETGA